jgi:chloramphenicol-sensitive protein RarD
MNASQAPPAEHDERLGVAAALAAYTYWGVAPIYFKWLVTVPALEIIVHRVLWSIPVLIVFLAWRDGHHFYRRLMLPWKTVAMLAVSGALVASNWLVFVWAVVNEQVLSTSLGYFIGPLVNFLLGYLILKEHLSLVQKSGIALAAAGTLFLGWYLGTLPWVALALAFTFGLYGLVRKMLPAGPLVGLLWEALLLTPLVLVIAWWLVRDGEWTFGSGQAGIDVLLALSGLVTVLPLIWFNTAARTLNLTTLGFFQYIAPSLSFLLSVFLFREAFTVGHAVAFSCIWAALVLVSLENLGRVRRMRLP